jgi:hypothetical protein
MVVLIHKKGDRTDCSNYRGISVLSNSYTILSSILLSRLSPYIDKIIGDHHLSDTGEKMGEQLDTTSAIYRLQERL